MNAARQQRNEPVRLTPSVWSQIPEVVSANSAGVSTPAAQTSAVTGPALLGHGEKDAAPDIGALAYVGGHRRGLTARLPDAPGDGVGQSLAVAGGQHDVSSAGRAMAGAAVAAPIPRLAPVTTATRLARASAPGHPPGLPRMPGLDHLPVEPLVSVQAPPRSRWPSAWLAAVAERGRSGRPARRHRRRPEMSSVGTRKPVTPSTITSLRAPRLNATTGVPHACASAAAIPKGRPHLAGNKTRTRRREPSPPSVAMSWVPPREPSRPASLVATRSGPGWCTPRRRRHRRRRSALRPRRAMSMATAAPFSRRSLPASTARAPGRAVDQGMTCAVHGMAAGSPRRRGRPGARRQPGKPRRWRRLRLPGLPRAA